MVITNWKNLWFHPILNGHLNFSCTTRAPKWLMQFSSNIPQGFALPEVLISALWAVKTDSEEAMGRQRTKWKPFVKPNCLTFTSEHDNVIYYLPHGSRYYRSKTLSSYGTDHFSFICISVKLFKPCSFIWRLPEIIQIPSLENKWEPHLSQAGVSHRDTNGRKEGEAKPLWGHLWALGRLTPRVEKHCPAWSGRVKSGLQILDGVHPPL